MILKTNNFEKIKNIRIKIFHDELELSYIDIFDGDDKHLEQFLILDGEKVVGIFRLRETNNSYKIERMGILSEYRLNGLGKSSLEEIKIYSKKMNKSKIILDSIYSVSKFYTDSGFTQIGDVYSKVGIPHVKMVVNL